MSNFTLEISGQTTVDFFNKAPANGSILFKDGTEMSAGIELEGSEYRGIFDLAWHLPQAVDPDEIAAIRIFETEIAIK